MHLHVHVHANIELQNIADKEKERRGLRASEETYQELEDKSSSDISVRKYSRDLLPVTWLSKLIWGDFVIEEEDRRLEEREVSLQQSRYIQINSNMYKTFYGRVKEGSFTSLMDSSF